LLETKNALCAAVTKKAYFVVQNLTFCRCWFT